jgi:hypothetical protein
MSFGETGRHATTRRETAELRRYSREVGRWPIVLETRDGWLLRLPLIDLSPGGAKVRLTERLTEGTRGRVYFLPPHWYPRAVEAIVWRIDIDGIVLRFADTSFGAPPAVRSADVADPPRLDEGAARVNHWIRGGPNGGTITFWVKPSRPTDLTDTSARRYPTVEHGSITVETAKNSDRTITVTLSGTRGGPFTLRRPIPPCASLGLHVRITWNADTVTLYLNELEAGRTGASSR